MLMSGPLLEPGQFPSESAPVRPTLGLRSHNKDSRGVRTHRNESPNRVFNQKPHLSLSTCGNYQEVTMKCQSMSAKIHCKQAAGTYNKAKVLEYTCAFHLPRELAEIICPKLQGPFQIGICRRSQEQGCHVQL